MSSSLLSSLRSSFSDQNTPSQATSSSIVQQTGTSDASQAATTFQPLVSRDQQLASLENVLNEVETSTVTSQPPTTSAQQPDLSSPATSDSTSPQQILDRAVQQRTAPDPLQSTVYPQVVDQAVAQANQVYQPTDGGSSKEQLASNSGLEIGAALQYVEQEKTAEIPPEVESYLQQVEDHTSGEAQEIVLADDGQQPIASHYPKKSVIVVPIDPQTEDAGKKRSPKFSVRWLVEWSQRIIKMFAGKVVYRQTS